MAAQNTFSTGRYYDPRLEVQTFGLPRVGSCIFDRGQRTDRSHSVARSASLLLLPPFSPSSIAPPLLSSPQSSTGGHA